MRCLYTGCPGGSVSSSALDLAESLSAAEWADCFSKRFRSRENAGSQQRSSCADFHCRQEPRSRTIIEIASFRAAGNNLWDGTEAIPALKVLSIRTRRLRGPILLQFSTEKLFRSLG